MAKGKTANPADAFRKAQRKKELKKNKAERSKARDFALVKRDTRDLEDDIAKLDSSSDLSNQDKARLKDLKTELEKINKKKEEYVQEHPEHRKLVYKSRKPAEPRDDKDSEIPALKKRNLFKKNGLPRHPERSIYYDPVMNPYGVPPPGLPYVERALLPNEVDSEAEESGDDEDIVMPEGPPPEELDSDDDIPMPEGPPPQVGADQELQSPHMPLPVVYPIGYHAPAPPVLPLISPVVGSLPPHPPPPPAGIPLMIPPSHIHIPPPPPPGFPPLTGSNTFMFPPPPPPPPGFPPPPAFAAPPMHPPFPPAQHVPIHPPPGFFPRKGGAPATIQDPLSPYPQQTYQAHRAARAAGIAGKATSGGVRLSSTAPNPPSAPAPSAVISAEPELRDLKKESTSFVPATLKRRKPGGAGSKVNAAPTVDPVDSPDGDDEAPAAARPDLLSALHDKLGAPPSKQRKVESKAKESPIKPKDDYDKFLEEMGDILGKGS